MFLLKSLIRFRQKYSRTFFIFFHKLCNMEFLKVYLEEYLEVFLTKSLEELKEVPRRTSWKLFGRILKKVRSYLPNKSKGITEKKTRLIEIKFLDQCHDKFRRNFIKAQLKISERYPRGNSEGNLWKKNLYEYLQKFQIKVLEQFMKKCLNKYLKRSRDDFLIVENGLDENPWNYFQSYAWRNSWKLYRTLWSFYRTL